MDRKRHSIIKINDYIHSRWGFEGPVQEIRQEFDGYFKYLIKTIEYDANGPYKSRRWIAEVDLGGK